MDAAQAQVEDRAKAYEITFKEAEQALNRQQAAFDSLRGRCLLRRQRRLFRVGAGLLVVEMPAWVLDLVVDGPAAPAR